MNNISLEKILSLKDTNNIPGMCVPMDTSIDKSMRVILRDGTVFKLKEYKSGLYYYDTASTNVQDRDKTNTTITPYPLLSPVT